MPTMQQTVSHEEAHEFRCPFCRNLQFYWRPSRGHSVAAYVSVKCRNKRCKRIIELSLELKR